MVVSLRSNIKEELREIDYASQTRNALINMVIHIISDDQRFIVAEHRIGVP